MMVCDIFHFVFFTFTQKTNCKIHTLLFLGSSPPIGQNNKIDNGHIYTDLYVKPTDKQLYLRQDSCHPSHTKKSLAYGLGIRIRRICERDDDYFKHRSDLKKQLRKRGYSGKLIEQQLQKVDKMDRGKLLEI